MIVLLDYLVRIKSKSIIDNIPMKVETLGFTLAAHGNGVGSCTAWSRDCVLDFGKFGSFGPREDVFVGWD